MIPAIVALGLAACTGAPADPPPGTVPDTDTAPVDTADSGSTTDSTPTETGDDSGTTATTPWTELDNDGDGYTYLTGDCNDRDATEYRGAAETAGDGLDTNCDGVDSDRFVLAEDLATSTWVGDLDPLGIGNAAGRDVAFIPGAFPSGAGILVTGPAQDGSESYRVSWPATWLVEPTADASGPLTTNAHAVWLESDYPSYGEPIVGPAGDIDEDGQADGVLGAWGAVSQGGRLSIYAAGHAGSADAADALFSISGRRGTFDLVGARACADLDLDADGTPDVVTNQLTDTLIFLDIRPGDYSMGDETLKVDINPMCNDARLGDLDGDGGDDVLLHDGVSVVAASGAALARGAVSPLFTLAQPDSGNWTFSAGDVNGDAVLDLAFGTSAYESAGDNSGRVGLYLGPLTGSRTFEDAEAFLDAEHAEVGLSNGLCINTDLDNDGDDEIIVGAPGVYTAVTGAVVVFLDPWAGVQTTAAADLVIDGLGLVSIFGSSLSGGSDADGDGFEDLVVGAPWDQSITGSVWLFSGASIAAQLP